MQKSLRQAVCAVFLSAVLSPASQAQGFADIGAETLYIDNLTRSEHATDAREDSAVILAAHAGLHIQPGDYTGLTITGALSRTQYRRYTGLSNNEAGLALTLSHKFGLGDRQPTLSAEVGLARNEYNQNFRDAWIYRVGVNLQKRLTDTFNLSGGLRYEKRDGDHDIPRPNAFPRPGSSWDLKSRTLFLAAELDLDEATWAGATYQWQDGDVVSTALFYPKVFTAATAITRDPLFGPVVVAYRIPARTQSIAVDLNWAVWRSGTLYLGVEFQNTHGRNDIDYDGGLIRGGIIHGF